MSKNSKSNQESSLVEPEVTCEPTGPRHLTESQAAALTDLSNLCTLAGHTETYGGFIPRAKPLIIGPSGSGKTGLVRRLCDSHKLPLFIVNSGSWVVFGARTDPHTLSVIRSFVKKNERGCLFLDEIDKCCPRGAGAWDQSWNLSVFTEILALLDSDQRLCTSGWSRSDANKFARNFFIVGAGAWQRKSKPDKDSSISYAQAVISDFVIPEEVAFRFNARLVVLKHPGRKDLGTAIRRVHSDMGLEAVPEGALKKLIDAAVESRCGMRWIEQYVSDLLSAHPKLRRKPEPLPASTKPEKTRVSQAHLNTENENFYRLLEAAEPSVLRLRVHVALIGRQLWQGLAQEPDPMLDLSKNDDIAPQEKLTPEMLNQACDDILFGLHLRYSLNDVDRNNRHAKLWFGAHTVLKFVKLAVKERADFLVSQQALSIFLNAIIPLSRILSAFTHLGTMEVASDE